MKKKFMPPRFRFFFLLLFIQMQISLTAEPAGPLKPRGPKSPLGPGKPRSPGWPGGPVMVVVAPEMASDPGGPGGPRGPASPGSPGAPWNPTPMFPFGPGLPGRPWSPFEIEWFFLVYGGILSSPLILAQGRSLKSKSGNCFNLVCKLEQLILFWQIWTMVTNLITVNLSVHMTFYLGYWLTVSHSTSLLKS